MVAETWYPLMADLWLVSNEFDQFSEEKYPCHKPITIISNFDGSPSKKGQELNELWKMDHSITCRGGFSRSGIKHTVKVV